METGGKGWRMAAKGGEERRLGVKEKKEGRREKGERDGKRSGEGKNWGVGLESNRGRQKGVEG